MTSASGALPAEGADGLRAARDGAQRFCASRAFGQRKGKREEIFLDLASSPLRVNAFQDILMASSHCAPHGQFLSFPWVALVEQCKNRMDLSHLEHEFSHPITLCFLPSSCIVTGDVRGQVKFYNGHLQLLACYDHSGTGPIQSISFSKDPPDSPAAPSTSSHPFAAR